jgi:acetyl/propionyl-CoA carboxylase alpha subunit
VDLIAEQIRVGLGAPLGYTQKDISLSGVGIEYRIIAEDPDNKFEPWVGRITSFGWIAQDWLKLHSQVPTDREYEIPTDFDPNLALAIIWGKDLAEAKARGVEFLNSLVLQGGNAAGEALKSNVEFLKRKTEGILVF